MIDQYNSKKSDEENHGVFLKALCKNFGKIVAVDNVSLHVKEGEFLTLLGPSGSGKTTTLMMIAGFEQPSSGEVLIRGENVILVPPSKRNIGMVFQNYALFPHMRIFENIAFPLKMRKMIGKNIKEKVKRVLEVVKLTGLAQRYPKELSGGQQQRVALARALVYDPPVLLMDEPLGALDKKLREHMQIEIKNIQRELKITTLYVTHDQEEALTMSDRIAVFNKGKIQQVGTPNGLYENPSSQFVADFLGESNFISGRITQYDDKLAVLTLPNNKQIPFPFVPGFEMEKEVQLAVRPEKIKFINNSDPSMVCLQGVITEVIYIGEIVKYRIQVSIETIIFLKQQISYGVKLFEKGEHVTIGWNFHDIKIF